MPSADFSNSPCEMPIRVPHHNAIGDHGEDVRQHLLMVGVPGVGAEIRDTVVGRGEDHAEITMTLRAFA